MGAAKKKTTSDSTDIESNALKHFARTNYLNGENCGTEVIDDYNKIATLAVINKPFSIPFSIEEEDSDEEQIKKDYAQFLPEAEM